MAKVAAKYNVPCCLMHNRDNEDYKNLMEDILDDLRESIKIAKEAGISDEFGPFYLTDGYLELNFTVRGKKSGCPGTGVPLYPAHPESNWAR